MTVLCHSTDQSEDTLKLEPPTGCSDEHPKAISLGERLRAVSKPTHTAFHCPLGDRCSVRQATPSLAPMQRIVLVRLLQSSTRQADIAVPTRIRLPGLLLQRTFRHRLLQPPLPHTRPDLSSKALIQWASCLVFYNPHAEITVVCQQTQSLEYHPGCC